MADQTTPAGATPAEPGATPGQSAPAASAADPATGTDQQLGDAGKRALEIERANAKEALKRATAAERRLAELEAAHQTDQEKAIAQARTEGAAEATAKADAKVRRAEVKRALSAAGCADVELAAMAGDFADLKVDDAGEVEGLDQALATFRTAHAALFAPKRPTGSADAGTSGRPPTAPTSFTREQLRDPKFYAANKDAILDAMRAGRITG
jgi:hypothetical protein